MSAVTLPAASGGSGEASYTLQPEVPGLQFDAAMRVLSGTPTEAGMHRMTYTATAGDGDATTLRFTIAVVDGLSFGAQTVATKSFAQATTIEPVTLPEAAGGSGTLSYALTPNVPGLLFDSATRELSGTPTTAGTWSMTYQVTDGAGDMASLNFTITVLGFASELIPDLPVLPDLSAEVDAAIDGVELPQATGGHGALVYSLQPEIPGLTFDAASRMLTGDADESWRVLDDLHRDGRPEHRGRPSLHHYGAPVNQGYVATHTRVVAERRCRRAFDGHPDLHQGSIHPSPGALSRRCIRV